MVNCERRYDKNGGIWIGSSSGLRKAILNLHNELSRNQRAWSSKPIGVPRTTESYAGPSVKFYEDVRGWSAGAGGAAAALKLSKSKQQHTKNIRMTLCVSFMIETVCHSQIRMTSK